MSEAQGDGEPAEPQTSLPGGAAVPSQRARDIHWDSWGGQEPRVPVPGRRSSRPWRTEARLSHATGSWGLGRAGMRWPPHGG